MRETIAQSREIFKDGCLAVIAQKPLRLQDVEALAVRGRAGKAPLGDDQVGQIKSRLDAG